MIPFKTTKGELCRLPEIVDAMLDFGLDYSFVQQASRVAEEDQGVFELMETWCLFGEFEVLEDLKKSIENHKVTGGVPCS